MRPRILVAGGGPVGMAFACAASDWDVRVLEAAPARAPAQSDDYDARIFAVSPGTRSLLRDLGAWERLDASRLAPVRRMEVFGDGGAKLQFAARPGAALAWVLEAGRLGEAIEAQAAALAHVEIRHGARAVDFGVEGRSAWASLDGGERLEADLLVGADGPDSPLRARMGIAFEELPYGEAAIVANFETERAHGETARQWFRADGVLAWLPLPGRRISIVWSTPTSHADLLQAMEERELERAVREAGGAALGDLRLVSAVARFPLRRVNVPQPIAPCVALIGDAAHAVHPLAGQGINLGFQDVRALCAALAGRSAVEGVGDLAVLRRYARERREDVTAMHFLTDALDKLFATGRPGAFTLRNLGLGMVESQSWAKAALARRAMR
ncbi:MAG TPA: FAD-dependent monooxygenase [Usitatibacter sp.]|nr:FAD-dependent monooxygenase [Usitatibacter sp.]